MNYTTPIQQERVIRRWVLSFIVALALSGLTAFAVETELGWLLDHWPPDPRGSLRIWAQLVYQALQDSNTRYPFLAYGYDWLAFGHLVIALFFIGVFRDPVQNKWVLGIGMWACAGVIPLAFIAGAVRGIPICWRLIDCSFGVIGLAPLVICYNKIGRLEKIYQTTGSLSMSE
ncbi:MAG TPA: hypothetical protein VHE34_20845 [Puia sp.]|uniref:hypothetical protein n=1 Tax=Puia sp. TaxID=2045100 RepID=UPI002C723733|nr:hypothetical protein [Puia sp.]HVU97690.1 hypothetical protein [Puia sp.]